MRKLTPRERYSRRFSRIDNGIWWLEAEVVRSARQLKRNKAQKRELERQLRQVNRLMENPAIYA